MKAKQSDDGRWVVIDQAGKWIAGPLDSEEEAKAWIRVRSGPRRGPR